MIVPVKFLWEQLDGPQISMLRDTVFEFLVQMLDQKLDYLNTLSVDTANDAHLTLLGTLAGFVRPTITEADKNYFVFTEHLEKGSDHGFSSSEDKASGGRFSDVFTGQGSSYVPLNREHYRALLKAFIKGSSEGELGSLALLDDICAELTALDLPGVKPFYKFSFEDGSLDTRAPGDVYIDMGNMQQWHNPLHIFAVLKGLADTVYAPIPKLFISIDTTPETPE